MLILNVGDIKSDLDDIFWTSDYAYGGRIPIPVQSTLYRGNHLKHIRAGMPPIILQSVHAGGREHVSPICAVLALT